MSRYPLVEEIVPAPDPWSAARRLSHLPHLIFFDSAGGPAELARYSYVTAAPFAFINLGVARGIDPLESLRLQWGAHSLRSIPDLPPFQGGAAGLFSYGLCQWLENIPRHRIDEFGLQGNDLAIGLYDWVLAWDHLQGRAWIISSGIVARPREHPESRARARIEFVQGLIQSDRPLPACKYDSLVQPVGGHPLPGFPNVQSNFDRPGFEAAVRRAVEYTHAGDCFQVNLAQRLLARWKSSPLELYGRLRRLNPAPFAGYFDAGMFKIISASPERFLQVDHAGRVQTRPIKGTRQRGVNPEHDLALADDLQESTKDRAENVMIVDLLRNDLGRVCEYGSVRVEHVCEVESYPTVHHLVSQVTGQLRPELTAVDLLRAAFPGGSVTGAPKVRAMEIIADLEPHARGPYCGCLGWIGFDGAMDTNILIRTFTAAYGWLQFPVGGGIVADSDPEREYEETLHKAAGLLRALE